MFKNIQAIQDPWEKIIASLMNAGVYDGTICRKEKPKYRIIMDLELLCAPANRLAKICLFVPNKQGNLKTCSIVVTKQKAVRLIVGDVNKWCATFNLDGFLAKIDEITKSLYLVEQGQARDYCFYKDNIPSDRVHDYALYDNTYISSSLVNMYNVQRLDLNDIMNKNSPVPMEKKKYDLIEEAFKACENGDIDKARSLYQTAIDSNHKEAYLNYGILEFEARNFDKARSLFKKASENNDADAMYMLGILEVECENIEAAKQAYIKACSLDHELAFTNLAILFYNDGDYSSAKQFYQRGIAHDDPNAYNGLGVLELETGDLSEARKLLLTAKEKGSRNAIWNLGRVEAKAQNISLAREYLKEACSQFEYAIDDLALLEMKAGNLELSKKYFEEAILKDGFDSTFQYAQVLEALGDIEAAKKYYTLALDEEHPEASEKLKSLERASQRGSSILGSVKIVKGFNIDLKNLETEFEKQNVRVTFQDLKSVINANSADGFYFVTNFRNMLTSYEVEFLKKHPFIKNVILIDPDFDEYEDVALDFSKRFPGYSYFVYDERALSKSASSTYSKEQIDLIVNNIRYAAMNDRVCLSEIMIERSVKKITEVVTEAANADANELSNVSAQWATKSINAINEANISPTRFNEASELGQLQHELKVFEANTSDIIMYLRAGTWTLYVISLIGEFSAFDITSYDKFISFGKERTLWLALYTSVFLSVQLCTFFIQNVFNKGLEAYESFRKNLQRIGQLIKDENSTAQRTITSTKNSLVELQKVHHKKFDDQLLERRVSKALDEINNTSTKSENKKAA